MCYRARMNKRGIIAVVVVIGAVLGVVWWKRGERDTRATAAATPTGQPQARGSSAVAPAADSAARVRVTVRDARGTIAGATVRLAPEGGDVVVVETGADGVAAVDGLAAGTWAISATANGYRPRAADARELASGEEASVELVLESGGRVLRGTVTDVDGGPIGGARVDAAALGAVMMPDRAIASALTAADGTYQVAVAEGQLLVAARSADYAAQSRVVDVGPGGATADFALVPGGVIEGIVLDEQTRAPAAAATIVARRDSAMPLGESGGHVGRAGPDGRFRITGLRPGAYELAATSGARRTKSPTLVGLGVAEQLVDIELLVGMGPVIRGKVVDETGAAVPDARIIVFGGRTGRDSAAKDGTFALEGLAPGKYTLYGRSDTMLGDGETQVELRDRDVTGVVVRVKRGIMLRGHVEPRQIATVTVEPQIGRKRMFSTVPPVTTGRDGEFSIGPLEVGSVTLGARAPSGDQGELTVEVTPAPAEVVLRLSPGGSIAGRVVDGEGRPVAGVTVMAAAQGDRASTVVINGVVTSGVQTLTNASGAFDVRGLAAGTYVVTALERGRPLRQRKKPPEITLAAAQRKTDVELAVDRPNGVISGVVLGPDGAPLADAWVSAQQDFMSMMEEMAEARGGRTRMMMRLEDSDGAGGGGFGPVLTDAQGRFAIAGLPHGKFDVIAEAKAGELRGRLDDVKPDASVTVRIAGVSKLSGTVTGPKGPPALFTVKLDGPTRTQRTFTDGKFELGRVDPGTYKVRVESDDGNGEASVVVAPATPATVAVELAANAVVVGTVVDGAGKPVAGLAVTVIEDTGEKGVRVSIEGPPNTTGPDGKFRVEHKAGRGTLVVLAEPRPTFRKGLELAAGKTLDVGTVQLESGPSPTP